MQLQETGSNREGTRMTEGTGEIERDSNKERRDRKIDRNRVGIIRKSQKWRDTKESL